VASDANFAITADPRAKLARVNLSARELFLPARELFLPARRLFVPKAPAIIHARELVPFAYPCRHRPLATIGTPTAIGTANSGIFNSGANSGNGTPLLAIVQTDNANAAISSVTDTAGNTYAKLIATPATANIVGAAAYYCASSTAAIVSGSTKLTVTTSNGSQWDLDIWVSISGAGGGGDVASQQLGTTTGTSASISSGTLASASEILFGGMWLAGSASTITESSGFTNIFGAGASQWTAVGYKIVSATTSIAYSPSWTTSQKFTALLVSLKATASGGGVVFRRTLSRLATRAGARQGY